MTTDQPQDSTLEMLLTPKEFEVGSLMGLGLTIDQTAFCLKKSPQTVNNQRRSIREKTGLESAVDFAILIYSKMTINELKALKKKVLNADYNLKELSKQVKAMALFITICFSIIDIHKQNYNRRGHKARRITTVSKPKKD